MRALEIIGLLIVAATLACATGVRLDEMYPLHRAKAATSDKHINVVMAFIAAIAAFFAGRLT